MKIANFDSKKDILIIAEIGNNHEGSYSLAEEMIGLAAAAGAGGVKFQVIVPEKLVSFRNIERWQQLKRFQLSYKEFERLSRVAKKENILFLATPFDIESARFLNDLVPAFKISSADNNFFPLIEFIARTAKPVLLSAGLADIEQLSKTKRFIEGIWNECEIVQEMAILHCVTSYPVNSNEANLLVIKTLRDIFSVTIGYSDHTLGIDAAVIAATFGARIIEKHFTINKEYSDFRDHKLSANFEEFSQMVKRINEAMIMLGDGIKCIRGTEKKMAGVVRRSIAAARDLNKGDVIAIADLNWIRPGIGVPVGCENKFIGKILNKAVGKGDMLSIDDVS